MCIRTTGTSKKFTILAQKCTINLKYMCRLSAAHDMVRQHYPHHILGIYHGTLIPGAQKSTKIDATPPQNLATLP